MLNKFQVEEFVESFRLGEKFTCEDKRVKETCDLVASDSHEDEYSSYMSKVFKVEDVFYCVCSFDGHFDIYEDVSLPFNTSTMEFVGTIFRRNYSIMSAFLAD